MITFEGEKASFIKLLMVQKITIQNFKSIQDLTIELGRVNVFIGENGSGKSNILEAIAMGSAAAEDKLENQFLASRGIRVTDPKAMRAGFEMENLEKDILIRFEENENETTFFLENENTHFAKWILKIGEIKEFENRISEIERNLSVLDDILGKKVSFDSWKETTLKGQMSLVNYDASFKNFLIFAPENHFLRRFEEETQVEPLGIRGEGLFKFISTLSYEKPELLQKIIENLELIDWFEGFEIPNDLRFTEKRIKIKDRFIEEGLAYFDQRSSNEGFLYLLFYFSLFVSDYTSKFFAIDNIDNAMNPKLVTRLVTQLTKLAKENNKQVILTTHNPAVLDGLDLRDDEQRLFVISRNALGHTKALRITHKAAIEGQEPVRMSEQFLRGYIGGLPKNF